MGFVGSSFQDNVDVVLAAILQWKNACRADYFHDSTSRVSKFASKRLRDLPEIILLETCEQFFLLEKFEDIKMLLHSSFWIAVLVVMRIAFFEYLWQIVRV